MNLNFFHRRSAGEPGQAAGVAAAKKGGEMSAEIVAAIAVALRLEEDEWHDWEPAVLTINHATSSTWSSKILEIMNQPVKK